MSNLNLSRRGLLQSLSVVALGAAGLAPAPAHAVTADGLLHQELSAMLGRSLITDSIQCGARIGDGVPDFPLVEAFMAKARAAASAGRGTLRVFLNDELQRDHDEGRIMVIDGWVLMRTEALAASSFVLLEGRDCRIADNAAQ